MTQFSEDTSTSGRMSENGLPFAKISTIIDSVKDTASILKMLHRNPKGVRFTDLAKAYQVRQVINAIEKLEAQRD